MNYSEKIKELLADTNNWNDLKVKLEAYNTSKTETTTKQTTAGKLFEYFAKFYFIIEPEQAQLYTNVWLYDEIPSDTKLKLNFPDRDFGIDLLLKDNQNRFIAVQCKFKNNEDEILQWSKDKIANPFALAEKCDSVMIFTNAADCVEEARQREKFNLICYGHLLNTASEVFSAIKTYIETKTIKVLKKYPRLPHQIKAVEKVVTYFINEPRAQLILPCGAGKTLTALWIKEDLKSKNTLVLFPSLALLRQFKTEWANQRSEDYIYLNVCSEKDIDTSTEDSTVTHTYEISGEVTTSPDRICDFLSISDKSKIVFSTYQSIEATVTALQLLPNFSFDLIICDEAHRTSGAKTNTFAIVHDEEKIRGKKRLYMTATPRVVSKNLKTRLGEDYDLLHDMSKSEVFGEEAFRMSFAEAIPDILVDYKIIGIGVTHKQVKEFIQQRRYVTEKYDLKEIADNYALDIVMEKYNATHAITFHSRVANARDFSLRHNAYFSPQVYSKHVSGEDSTSKRVKILREFKEQKKGVVSNARCLTEGVDVPIIDLIYFCDPRSSKIDIVQASGRALRKDPNGKKTIGYIVVPIYHHIDEDMEKEIDKKPYFQNLISIIRSLCDHDERLRAEIDDIAFGKGQKTSKRIEITYNDTEIEKIVKLDGLDKNVRQFLFDQIIEKTKNLWNVRFEELKEFKNKYNTTDVGRKYKQEHLRYWCQEQRDYFHEKKLAKEKIEKLEGVGFDWKGELRGKESRVDSHRKWFKQLEDYAVQKGDCKILAREPGYEKLGSYVHRNLKLIIDEIKEDKEYFTYNYQGKMIPMYDFLEIIGFFKSNAEKIRIADKMIKRLKKEKKINPNFSKEDFNKLSKTDNLFARDVNRIRSHMNDLENYPKSYFQDGEEDELLQLGFVPPKRETDWSVNFLKLKEFLQNNSQDDLNLKDNRLYHWCRRQMANLEKGIEPPNEAQLQELKKINFNFNFARRQRSENERWEEFFDHLIEYKEANGNTNVPGNLIEFEELYKWCSYQRGHKERLIKSKIERLDAISFSWVTVKKIKSSNKVAEPKPRKGRIINAFSQEKWDLMFDKLIAYVKSHKTFVVKKNSKENIQLNSWISTQRNSFKKKNLNPLRISKFNSIDFPWAADSGRINSKKEVIKRKAVKSIDSWDKNYLDLINYKLKNGDANVPKQFRASTLAQWVSRQRYFKRKGRLTPGQIDKLNLLNFEWDGLKTKSEKIIWLRSFEKLKGIFKAKGNSTVTKSHPDQQLASWILQQRYRRKRNKLKQEFIDLLDTLKFDWNPEVKGGSPDDEQWFEMLKQLEAYKSNFGDCNVSQLDKVYKKLGRWVNDQRMSCTRNKIKDYRKDLLNQLGVVWNTKDHEWDTKLKMLDLYNKKHGDFNVKQSDKEFGGLYNWIYKIKRLGTTKEKIQRLQDIGYDTTQIN